MNGFPSCAPQDAKEAAKKAKLAKLAAKAEKARAPAAGSTKAADKKAKAKAESDAKKVRHRTCDARGIIIMPVADCFLEQILEF